MANPIETVNCPHCGSADCESRRSHQASGSVEYLCLTCKSKHTRRPGTEDTFAIFPGDIEAAVDPSVGEPWF